MSKLIGYQCKVLWTPGKTHHIADALSRAPVFPPNELQGENFADVCNATTNLQENSDPILIPLINTAKADIDYQLIMKAISEVKNPNHFPLHTLAVNSQVFGLN